MNDLSHDHVAGSALTARLQRVLRHARAEPTRLPEVPEIILYLLNQDFSNAALTDDEARAVLEYPAYWMFCWASGQVLARHLLDNPDPVRGRRVLDFGSGSGVAGIAAAIAGAAQVIACDLDPDARLATRCNAALNNVEIEVRDDFEAITEPLDIILVADVLYDRENLAWLPRFLDRAPTVLLADSRIKDFSMPGYTRLGSRLSTTWPDLDEHNEFRQVNLYRGSA